VATIGRLQLRVPKFHTIAGKRIFVGWRTRTAAELLKEQAERQYHDDAALGERVRRKNEAASRRSGQDRHDEARDLREKIAVEATKYRRIYTYSRDHSTRAMAKRISRILGRPEPTIRRHLTALRIR
jgi:hypothetical protein